MIREEKQIKGGRKGAMKTNSRDNDDNKESSTNLSGSSRVPRRGNVESLVKSNSVKQSQKQSPRKEYVDDPFVSEYQSWEAEEGCSPFEYARASGK